MACRQKWVRRWELAVVGLVGTIAALTVTTAATASSSSPPGRPPVVFDGDSQTASAFGGGVTMPELVRIRRGGAVVNVARAGQTLVDLNAHPEDATAATRRRGDLVVWAGTNDLARGANATDAYLRLATYASARRAEGYRVVMVTLLPRSEPGAASGEEAQRRHFNDLVRALWHDSADALADVAADPRIGNAGDETDTDFFAGDRLHLGPEGRSIVAGLVAAALPT